MRFTIDLSNEIDEKLTAIARQSCISKAEVMRRAFALMAVAQEEKEKGNSLGIVRSSGDGLQAIARVVGL
jgi:predicted transcriptional regulator